jgi:hypothetical protein
MALMLYAARSAFHPLRSLLLSLCAARASFSDKTLSAASAKCGCPHQSPRLPAAAWWPRTPVIKQKHTGRPINQPLCSFCVSHSSYHTAPALFIEPFFVVSYFVYFFNHRQLFVLQGTTNMLGNSAKLIFAVFLNRIFKYSSFRKIILYRHMWGCKAQFYF